MLGMPMAMMGHPCACIKGMEKPAAAAKKTQPAILTAREDIAPLAVMRRGPWRLAVSAFLSESRESLNRLQAIWMHTALSTVKTASDQLRLIGCHCGNSAGLTCWYFHTIMQPAHTATMPAGRVLGRAAKNMDLMVFIVYVDICGGLPALCEKAQKGHPVRCF